MGNLKLLYGDELLKKQEDCEMKGFSDVVKSVLQRIMNGEDVYRCEIQFLLKKLQ